MGLIPAGVLTDTLTVLRSTRTPNGEGGWTDAYNAVGTVRGTVTVRRRVVMETIAAGQPSDQQLVDINADTSAVTVKPSDRLKAADGRVYELVALAFQGPLLIGVGRAV